jgi:uncharacterized protein YifE (UPF0438 family)
MEDAASPETCEGSPFPCEHVKNLTAEERSTLTRWGYSLQALFNGKTKPSTDGHREFVRLLKAYSRDRATAGPIGSGAMALAARAWAKYLGYEPATAAERSQPEWQPWSRETRPRSGEGPANRGYGRADRRDNVPYP